MAVSRGAILAIVASAILAAEGCASSPVRHDPARKPPAVRWDAASGSLRCESGNAQLDVPDSFRGQVRVISGDKVTIVLPTGSALIATVGDSPSLAGETGLSGDLQVLWKTLHQMAGGADPWKGPIHVEADLRRGRLVARYDVDSLEPFHPGPGMFDIENAPDRWRLVYVEAGRCRFAAVDYKSEDRPSLTYLIDYNLHVTSSPRSDRGR
jgi:hypothetical protein